MVSGFFVGPALLLGFAIGACMFELGYTVMEFLAVLCAFGVFFLVLVCVRLLFARDW